MCRVLSVFESHNPPPAGHKPTLCAVDARVARSLGVVDRDRHGSKRRANLFVASEIVMEPLRVRLSTGPRTPSTQGVMPQSLRFARQKLSTNRLRKAYRRVLRYDRQPARS